MRNARNLACNEPPDDIGNSIAPPFTGGQCEGQQYTVTSGVIVRIDGVPTGPPNVETSQGPGPVRLRNDTTANSANRNAQSWFVEFSDGTSEFLGGGSVANPAVITAEVVQFDVVTSDGSPDICGDPPPTGPPYTPQENTTTQIITYEDNSQTNVNVPVTFVFAPVSIRPTLEVVVPVTVSINGGPDIAAEYNLTSNQVTFNSSQNVTVSTSVEDTTIVINTTGPQGESLTEEQETEETIIGLFVKTLSVGSNFKGTQRENLDGGSEFYIPRLATVTFKVKLLATEGTAWTEEIQVKYTNQIVMCPVPWGAVDYNVQEENGVALQVSSIKGESERQLLLKSSES